MIAGIMMTNEMLWLGFGFFAQFIFFMRFVVQWIHAERKQSSEIPVIFWYLSILGAVMLLMYSIHRADPVFATGQALALVIYIRNLMLLRKSDI